MSFFDRLAPRYDRTFAPDARATEADLRALLTGRRGVVLDLGCGTGRAFPHLVALGFRVIGMDASAEMLREAGRRGSSRAVSRLRADLYGRFPLRDASVDGILALHSVLAHPPGDRLRAWAHVGAEIRRVAREGALVAIDLPEPRWAEAHLQRIDDERYLYQDRGATIVAEIPEPSRVVEALGLPLSIAPGPLGVRAIGELTRRS